MPTRCSGTQFTAALDEEKILNRSDALYYPYIAFSNPNWIKAMAMFYRTIYRIVPDNTIPDDPEVLQPLLEDGSIGRMIDPIPYAAEASNEFLGKAEGWSAAGLWFDPESSLETSSVHKDKMDERVRQLFVELGCSESEEWLSVPTEHASNYMLYLAQAIGSKNKLNLITHEWAPWTATTFFGLDGQVDEFMNVVNIEAPYSDDPFALFSLVLGETTPINIGDIPAHRIVEFREKRNCEIENFRGSIFALYDELQNLENPVVREDRIRSRIAEFEAARDDYQRSADILKAKGWFGISFMGLTAPVTLAELFKLPSTTTMALAGSALALGAIFNIKSTRKELETLRKNHTGSYLAQLRKEFRHYTSFRGGGDINFHAFNCMEEYVND